MPATRWLIFVFKKDGRLRVILDGRIPSSWFEEPDTVHLASGQAFACLEVDSHSPVFLGGADIKDAFYRIELPSDLRDLFGLPSVRACHVGVQSILGITVHPSDMIVPCFKGVPMGWNQSLWICQSLHEIVAGRVETVTEASRFVDRKPATVLRPFGHTEYVDNFIALGQSRAPVLAVTQQVEHELNDAGLPTHPLEISAGGSTLGWTFQEDFPCWCQSSHCLEDPFGHLGGLGPGLCVGRHCVHPGVAFHLPCSHPT